MKISNVTLSQAGDRQTLSANCGGFEVYYSFPAELPVRVSADPFLAATLIPAMATRSDIFLPDDVPVSRTLLANLETLQKILSRWEFQLGRKLYPVRIEGGALEEANASPDGLQTAFFSGGVDGTFTLLRHEDEIDALLFVQGIDMQPNNDSLFLEAATANATFLSARGKRLLVCATNVRLLGHQHGVGWTLCFGGGLSSIALAAGVERCLIAGGFTYADVQHEGSNYITDPLWSNGVTRIEHDGAEASRLEKIQRIAEEPGSLDLLRVCWQDAGYNCGQCEKCLRTMLSLRLLGLEAARLPELTDQMVKTRIARSKVYTSQGLFFIEDNLRKAEEVGDRVVAVALRRVRRDFLLRRHLKGLRDAFARRP